MDPNGPDRITFFTSDGKTWEKPVPEYIRREIAACRAIDVLEHRVKDAREVAERARRAAQATSAETPVSNLVIAWSEHSSALVAAIDGLTEDSEVVIDAVQRMLFLK